MLHRLSTTTTTTTITATAQRRTGACRVFPIDRRFHESLPEVRRGNLDAVVYGERAEPVNSPGTFVVGNLETLARLNTTVSRFARLARAIKAIIRVFRRISQ